MSIGRQMISNLLFYLLIYISGILTMEVIHRKDERLEALAVLCFVCIVIVLLLI